MWFTSKCNLLSTVALLLSILLSFSPKILADLGSGNVINKGIGGLVGAATGAIAGGVAGANAGADAAANGASLSINSNSQIGGSSSSSSASLNSSSSLSGSNIGGFSASGSLSFANNNGIQVSTTSKPEGLVGKIKEIFKESKEIVKNTLDIGKDDKRVPENTQSNSGVNAGVSFQASGGDKSNSNSFGAASSSSSSSSAASAASSSSSSSSSSSAASSSSTSPSSSSSSASAASSSSSSLFSPSSSESSSPDDSKMSASFSGSARSGPSSLSSSVESGVSISNDRISGSANFQIGNSTPKPEGFGDSSRRNEIEMKKESLKKELKELDNKKPERFDDDKKEGPIDKVGKLISKGADGVRETIHKIEDKAQEVNEKFSKSLDENLIKPIQTTSGSGHKTSEGQMTFQASVNAQLRGPEKEKHLVDIKRKQESEIPRYSNLREVVEDAKMRGTIPREEDRSNLKGNRPDEKSVAVEVFDKAHEISKIPVQSVLRPIDKMLGYEKDPLMRIYDNSHELLRKPLGLVAKPVETVLSGAFKTTDEAKREKQKQLAVSSEQERRDAKLKEEKARKENRSVVGEIADRTLELATKPFEIALKPIDHVFGLDKDGKKNPLLQTLEDIYGLSKRPVDAIAKPLESVLRKMADGEQVYQVSIRFNRDNVDPKLVTRLADGALNIADRVLTKPLEIVMKPLNHALGFDEPGRKNPIVEAAHSLKNATKVGVELFTKPIDRIIHEIAEIGEIKSEQERQIQLERQKEEASRLVKALDKLHDVAQTPFEIVLRPMSRVFGMNKDGDKEPFLRAWDIIHQVLRTPIQVISKPVEDAILGEQPRRQDGSRYRYENGKGRANSNSKATVSANFGKFRANASITASASSSSQLQNQKGYNEEAQHRKNVFIDGIKRVEKYAARPFDVITSPIRRLILGEDDERIKYDNYVRNRDYRQNGQYHQRRIDEPNQPDKIMSTLEKMNNVILKPLEVMTQPISDLINQDNNQSRKNERQNEMRQQGQGSSFGQAHFQMESQLNSNSQSKSNQQSHDQSRFQNQQNSQSQSSSPQFSASFSAQARKS